MLFLGNRKDALFIFIPSSMYGVVNLVMRLTGRTDRDDIVDTISSLIFDSLGYAAYDTEMVAQLIVYDSDLCNPDPVGEDSSDQDDELTRVLFSKVNRLVEALYLTASKLGIDESQMLQDYRFACVHMNQFIVLERR